ncbi:MAG: hypothetical protein R3B39_01270 [Candidatus Paceibacterota bacterium]
MRNKIIKVIIAVIFFIVYLINLETQPDFSVEPLTKQDNIKNFIIGSMLLSGIVLVVQTIGLFSGFGKSNSSIEGNLKNKDNLLKDVIIAIILGFAMTSIPMLLLNCVIGNCS